MTLFEPHINSSSTFVSSKHLKIEIIPNGTLKVQIVCFLVIFWSFNNKINKIKKKLIHRFKQNLPFNYSKVTNYYEFNKIIIYFSRYI